MWPGLWTAIKNIARNVVVYFAIGIIGYFVFEYDYQNKKTVIVFDEDARFAKLILEYTNEGEYLEIEIAYLNEYKTGENTMIISEYW